MRLAVLLVVLLTSIEAFGQGMPLPIEGGAVESVRRVVIYGDSLSDNNDAASCDWCSSVTTAGVEIWNAATGGARTYDDSATCDAGDSYAGCYSFVERQMEYHDGSCRNGTANSPNGGSAATTPLYGAAEVTTCVDDLAVNSHNVVVIFAGTNDIIRVSNAAWQSTYFALTKAAYQRMLQTVKDNSVSCVMVIPPYVYDSANGYDQANLNLGELADYLDGTAATSIADDMGVNYPTQCVVVDMREVIDEYTASYGIAETLADLYDNCLGVGDEGAASGCIHFSVSGSNLMGDRIFAGIQKAIAQAP